MSARRRARMIDGDRANLRAYFRANFRANFRGYFRANFRDDLRLSLLALAAALALVLIASVVAAVGVPGGLWPRIAMVLGAWLMLGGVLARLFLPSGSLPFVPSLALPRQRLVARVGGDGDRSAVALTFDDGPHPDTTPAILSALAAAQVKATFFLVGEQVRRHPDLARRIVAEGHAVGNHTQRHRLLVFRTASQVRSEIAACQETITAALGHAPSLFRPPHGFAPIGVHRDLERLGLRLVTWQGAARDTDAPGVAAIVERTLAIAGPGRILLLHDNPSTGGQTAEAIADIVAGCRARGLRFVRVDEDLAHRDR